MDWSAPRACLSRHRRQLLQKANVVGCGIGWKQIGGQPTLQPAICVFVRRKVPLESLAARDRIEPVIDGMATDVIASGEIRLLPMPEGPVPLREGEEGVSERTVRRRPALPGMSIANVRVTAGTLGAVVRENASGRLMVLSNNHVLANSSDGRDGRAQIGDPIVQPGPFDGGRAPGDTIARLTRFHPLSATEENEIDAAVGAVLSDDLVEPAILGLGRPVGTTAPRMGLAVRMSGRTSGLVDGSIIALDVTAQVGLPTGAGAWFVHQIATSRMARPGDSGSLLVDTRVRAVGLVFAGSETISLANEIQRVLALLDVSLL